MSAGSPIDLEIANREFCAIFALSPRGWHSPGPRPRVNRALRADFITSPISRETCQTAWRSAVFSNSQATSSRDGREHAEKKKRPSVRAPDPSTHLLVLLLASRLLRRCRRSIPFAETLPTPTIASFDEARSQVVRAAVAAHELLCVRLRPGLLHRRSCGLGVYWPRLLTVCQFRAFHSF